MVDELLLSLKVQTMNIKTVLPAAGLVLLVGLFGTSLVSRASGNNDTARRSWIQTLNIELKAGIDYDTVKNNPLANALFGVADAACLNQAAALSMAQSMMPASEARYAVQRFDERYCLVKHQNS